MCVYIYIYTYNICIQNPVLCVYSMAWLKFLGIHCGTDWSSVSVGVTKTTALIRFNKMAAYIPRLQGTRPVFSTAALEFVLN